MGQIWYKVFGYFFFCNFKRRNDNFYFATCLSLTNFTTVYNKNNFHLLYTSTYSLKVCFFKELVPWSLLWYIIFLFFPWNIFLASTCIMKGWHIIYCNSCGLQKIIAKTPLTTKKTSISRGMIKSVPQFQLTWNSGMRICQVVTISPN